MTQADDQPLSEVAPLLVAALVCDVAVTDPSSGKRSLIGIFDHVRVAKFPTTRRLSLYFKIADAQGRYDFDVRYVQASTGEVLARAEGKVVARDRLSSSDLHLAFPPLPIPTPGRYEFQVWANSMFLGSTFMDASQIGSQAASAGD